jgi:hypothetical protein
LQWFKTYPKISWVKSHQDDKVYDATEMPLDTYLNSEADALATVIGWDNLLRGNFPKQWKIQQKMYETRRKLNNPFLYEKTQRRKRREETKNKNKNKNKNKTKKKKNQKNFMRSFKLSSLSYKKYGRTGA